MKVYNKQTEPDSVFSSISPPSLPSPLPLQPALPGFPTVYTTTEAGVCGK